MDNDNLGQNLHLKESELNVFQMFKIYLFFKSIDFEKILGWSQFKQA